MRPGCVHLIANVRTPGGQAALERCVLGGGDLEAAVAALTRSFETSGLLRNRRLVVQVGMGLNGTPYVQHVQRAAWLRTPASVEVQAVCSRP